MVNTAVPLPDFIQARTVNNVKGDAVQYVLETVYKTADIYAQSVEECSEMVSEPVDGCFYILSYVYHNSIAF